MLLVRDNSTEQINSALLDIDTNIEKKTKTSLISGIVSAVYGAIKVMFEELKKTFAPVAYTGSYNDLINKPSIPEVVNTVENGNMNAVTSNAVKTELDTSYYNKQSVDSLLANYRKITVVSNTETFDANTHNEEGLYRFPDTYNGTATNLPDWQKNGGAMLEVYRLGSRYCYQRFIPYSSTEYVRFFDYGSDAPNYHWSNWEKLTTETDLNNALADYVVGKSKDWRIYADLETALNSNVSLFKNGSSYIFCCATSGGARHFVSFGIEGNVGRGFVFNGKLLKMQLLLYSNGTFTLDSITI